MSRVWMFADESGNFDFSVRQGASRYFILTTMTVSHCGVGDALLGLYRELVSGLRTRDGFHASEDDWPTRTEVLSLLANHDIRIDATILEKRKARPSIRTTESRFYQLAWYLHMKYVTPRVSRTGDELRVFGASLGTNARKLAFHAAIDDVMQQVAGGRTCTTTSVAAGSDPCLQAVDYCSWALARRWETGRDDAYKVLRSKIRSEFAPFAVGTVYFY